jgi:hypothetical protein
LGRSVFDGITFLADVFVEETHKILYGEEANAKVLTVGKDMATKDVLINIGSGRTLLFEFLHSRVVNDITCLFDSIGVERLTGVNDDICQKVSKNRKRR